ncbi:MAG: HD domain-containing protein [Eubacteriales bacterium]
MTRQNMSQQNNQINLDKALLDIYATFGMDHNNDKLLERLLRTVVEYTGCDGGTLYLRSKDTLGNDCLNFKIILTKSMGVFMNFNQETLLPNSSSLVPMKRQFSSAYCAIVKKTINIPDVYNCEDDALDFSGTKNFDMKNNYKTTSVLNFPIENDFNEVIAVIQLINYMENGTVAPFPERYNDILESFGTQVGIVLRNLEYAQKNKEQLYSFVEVLATAIDEMSPFNANHTNNMVKITNTFLDWLQYENKSLQFTPNEREQLLMSIRLHDIGKITTPPEILNRETRLDIAMETVESRIEKMILSYEICYFKKKFTEDFAKEKIAELKENLSFIKGINTKGFLEKEERETLETLQNVKYYSVSGVKENLLTDKEYASLSATRGNLTTEQWKTMENHVKVTRKFLEQIKFSHTYQDVVAWASAHHEALNGTGYPLGLKEDSIPKAVRLITIIDSYEAMVATDRPYKKKNPMSPERAMGILRERVEKGELDEELVELLAESLGL